MQADRNKQEDKSIFNLIHQVQNSHPQLISLEDKSINLIDQSFNYQKVHHSNRDLYEVLNHKIRTLEEKVRSLQRRNQRENRQKKKMRRKANQIQRHFECYFQQCGKIYGSHTSLKNHLKLKHSLKVHKTKTKSNEPNTPKK